MSLSLANLRRAQVLLGALKVRGVRDYIVSPGSRNTPLILALEWMAERFGSDEIQIHRVLDERSAGFFALGLGRMRGVPAALICTSGTAAAHYFPAVIEAAQSHIPLLILSADRPQELRGVGSLQTIDQNKLFGDYVRLFCDLGAPTQDDPKDGWVAACGARAVEAAVVTNPGPVHLNVPFREPLWTEGEALPEQALPRVPEWVVGTAKLNDEQLHELWEHLCRYDKGVIIAGPRDGACDASDKELARHVEEVAAHLGWPVIAEPGSGVRARLSSSEVLVPSADVILRSEKVAKSFAPDCVLRFGKTPTSKVVRLWAAAYAERTVVIESNPGWHDPDAVVTDVIRSRPDATLSGLSKKTSGSKRDATWLASWKQAARISLSEIEKVSREVFWEGGVARNLVAALPEASLLHVANSMPIRDLDAMVESFPEDTLVVHHRGANGIDGALSAFMGEAHASGLPSVLLCGDLTFLHDAGSLQMAAARTEALTIVVIDNRGGGIFEHLAISKHPDAFERNFITPHEQNLLSLSRSAGVRAYEALDARSLGDLLGEEIQRPGLGVIVVPMDRIENTKAHRELWDGVKHALERELL